MEPVAYPASAVERAMKVQEVILRAIDGRLKWYQAAEILGISDRQMRRWRRRYEQRGYDGLFDRRRRALASEGPGVPLADAITDLATPQVPELRGAAPGKPRYWAWADLMRRAFDLDVLACPRCGGRMRLLATIEDPQVIRKYSRTSGSPEVPFLSPSRPPPARAADLFADMPA